MALKVAALPVVVSQPASAVDLPPPGPLPWERPWWLPVRGAWPTFGWLVLIHLTALAGLILFPLPGWGVFLGALLLSWLGGLGTTVAYHRAIAHRSVKLHPVVRQFLTFMAMLNGSGSPRSWTANHRHHHAKADSLEDVSSPKTGGFWWSHLRWLWQAPPASTERYCRDIDGASYRFWCRIQVPVLALSYFGGFAFGWAGFFWLGSIRLVYALHAQCCVNSICHLDGNPALGEDSSKNVWWLGIFHLFQGENWHGNHHLRPGSAKLGWKKWQLDTGWWAIRLLEKVGLARDVRSQSSG